LQAQLQAPGACGRIAHERYIERRELYHSVTRCANFHLPLRAGCLSSAPRLACFAWRFAYSLPVCIMGVPVALAQSGVLHKT
jgi:hypothetical protein